MKRIALTDNTGGWFDLDAATNFEEETNFDGSENVSVNVGQWNHQSLFRTKTGRWVLYTTSQWQGTIDSWRAITDEEAARWLVRNDHAHESVETLIESLEL